MMRLVWQAVTVVVVFVGVGWWTAHAVVQHAAVGTPVAQVRLSSAMAGLFAGGAAAVVVGIAVVRRRGSQS